MQRTMTVVGLVLVLGLTGCGSDRYEAKQLEELELLKELNGVLATVTDEASLDAAVPRLEALNARFEALEAERTAPGPKEEARRRELLAKYADKLKEQQAELGRHVARIDAMGKAFLDKRSKAMKDVPAFD
jgi:hypothetical protein